MADAASASHKHARSFTLASIAAVALMAAVMLVATWGVPHAFFGWNVGSDGETLINVVRDGPAWRAGLRSGDRLDWSTLPLVARANLAIVEAVSAGTAIDVRYARGGVTHTAHVTPKPWPAMFESASRILTLAGLFFTAIGIGLVQLRPSRMTWGFLLSSLLWAYPSWVHWLWAQGAPWKFAVGEGSASILLGAYAAGILIFMSRFPSDRARGPLQLLDRVAVPFGALVAALSLYICADILLSARPPAVWALFLTQSVIPIALFAIALAALATSYLLTNSSDRQRIVPVLLAFAAYVACNVAHTVYSAFFTNPSVSAVQYLTIALSMCAVAVTVANGVIRHRVLDVSFAISRTVAYTILTSLIVGVFALIDFISSKLLDRLQFQLLLEAAAALAFGIWLNALHSRIDRFVDRVLFRRRHLAENRLRRAARTLPHAESAEFIDDALVAEVCDALALASAAVFRRDGEDAFARVSSRNWREDHARRVSRGDRIVVSLLSELQAINISEVRWPRTDVPAGADQPILAVPFVVRHDVLGFAVYGGHVGGEAIDPDEEALLVALANAAAAAYEHLQLQALDAEAKELRTENAMLVREQRLLREMVDALRSTPHELSS